MSNAEEYEPYESHGWRGLAAPGWGAGLRGAEPLGWYLSQPHQLVRDRPGGRTWRVAGGGFTCFVKHVSPMYAGAKGTGWHLGKRLRWAVRGSPAMRTLRVTREMERRGVSAATVLHVVRRGVGMNAEELVVTRAVDAVRLADALAPASDADRAAILNLLARGVAEMHERGVTHGHLLPGHIFIKPDRSGLVFIDNDENRLHAGPAPWKERLTNLKQLALPVIPNYRQWRRFFTGYFERCGVERTAARSMLASVLTHVRRRLTRRGTDRVTLGRRRGLKSHAVRDP